MNKTTGESKRKAGQLGGSVKTPKGFARKLDGISLGKRAAEVRKFREVNRARKASYELVYVELNNLIAYHTTHSGGEFTEYLWKQAAHYGALLEKLEEA